MDRLSDPSRPRLLATVVIPAKNEDEKVLAELKYKVSNYPYAKVEVLIVDDGSTPPLQCADLRHATSRGYGAALKTGIKAAQGDCIITMDGDGQHSHVDAYRLLDNFIYLQPIDMLIGSRRIRETSLKRFLGRKFLNMTASLFAWRWIPDLNSGLRIFRRADALSYESILCNSFSFTTSLTMCLLTDDLGVDWIPIRVQKRASGQSHVHVIKDGLTTLKHILVIGGALRTRTFRNRFRWLWAWARRS